jgi:hypothetical protein
MHLTMNFVTETCRLIVEEENEMRVVKSRDMWKTALRAVFMYIRQSGQLVDYILSHRN